MPKMRNFEMDLSEGGSGTIKINGHAVPFVTKVQVEAETGEPNRVHLDLIGVEVTAQLAEADLDTGSFRALEEIVATFNESSDDKIKMRVA